MTNLILCLSGEIETVQANGRNAPSSTSTTASSLSSLPTGTLYVRTLRRAGQFMVLNAGTGRDVRVTVCCGRTDGCVGDLGHGSPSQKSTLPEFDRTVV